VAFPRLNSEQAEQLERSRELIAEAIRQAGGAIPFDRYMELALYAPGAGYYVNGARKFGEQGDFVTAPEISPLFSQCMANQCADLLQECSGNILEFGAGSGMMAADILARLQDLDALPERYQIMELSAELRARQAETLALRVPALSERVQWLDRLPDPGWSGVVLGNELLDAMPVSRFRRGADGWEESFVELQADGLGETWRPASPKLAEALDTRQARVGVFPPGYVSEINLRLPGWMRAVADFLQRGAVLLLDYGYTERAYYHPERDRGTLICHFRHRAHADFLALPGLQDITANVDFSAVAEAGVAAGLELVGYTTQAQFLIGCGLDGLLAGFDAADPDRYLPQLQAAKQLILPSGMGERFQAIGFARDIAEPMRGFAMRDMRDSL
jgi:SAM-dependent MidA family methyltransferase